MFFIVRDRDYGDKLLSLVPIEKYQYADPMWQIKARYFAGQYQMMAVFDEEICDVVAMMLYTISGDTCNIHLMWAHNVFRGNWRKVFREFFATMPNVKKVRTWTSYPKAWERLTGMKQIYAMMEGDLDEILQKD